MFIGFNHLCGGAKRPAAPLFPPPFNYCEFSTTQVNGKRQTPTRSTELAFVITEPESRVRQVADRWAQSSHRAPWSTRAIE